MGSLILLEKTREIPKVKAVEALPLEAELCVNQYDHGQGMIRRLEAARITPGEIAYLCSHIWDYPSDVQLHRIPKKTSNCVYATTNTDPIAFLKVYASKKAAVLDSVFDAFAFSPQDVRLDDVREVIELGRPILDGIARYQENPARGVIIENIPEEALDIKTHAVWFPERPESFTLQDVIDEADGDVKKLEQVRRKFDGRVLQTLHNWQLFALSQLDNMRQIGRSYGENILDPAIPYTSSELLAIIREDTVPLPYTSLQEEWNIAYQSVTTALRAGYDYTKRGKQIYSAVVLGDLTPANISFCEEEYVFFPDSEFARMGIVHEDLARFLQHYKCKRDIESCYAIAVGCAQLHANEIYQEDLTSEEKEFARQLFDYAVINQNVRVLTRQVYETLSGKKTTAEVAHSFQAKRNTVEEAFRRIYERENVHPLITSDVAEHKRDIAQLSALLQSATLPNSSHKPRIAYGLTLI